MLTTIYLELLLFSLSSNRCLTRVHLLSALLAAFYKFFWWILDITYIEIIIFSWVISLIYCIMSINCYPRSSKNSQIWSFVQIPQLFFIKIYRHLSTIGGMVGITFPIRRNSIKWFTTLMRLLQSITDLKKTSGTNFSKI